MHKDLLQCSLKTTKQIYDIIILQNVSVYIQIRLTTEVSIAQIYINVTHY